MCTNDDTPTFESRTDLNLSCNGLLDQVPYALRAAALSNDGKRLLLVIENGTTDSDTDHILCEYALDMLQQKFAETWNACQRNADARYIEGVVVKSNLHLLSYAWL